VIFTFLIFMVIFMFSPDVIVFMMVSCNISLRI
jgi:hypothetical protein